MTLMRVAAAMGLLAAVAALAVQVWRAAPPAPAADDAEVARIVAACTEDMVRQTCRVMGAPNGAKVADGTVIFVAGIGAIDASVYNELRASGDAMCQTVRRACVSQWNGAACQTARALYTGS